MLPLRRFIRRAYTALPVRITGNPACWKTLMRRFSLCILEARCWITRLNSRQTCDQVGVTTAGRSTLCAVVLIRYTRSRHPTFRTHSDTYLAPLLEELSFTLLGNRCEFVQTCKYPRNSHSLNSFESSVPLRQVVRLIGCVQPFDNRGSLTRERGEGVYGGNSSVYEFVAQ